MIWRGFLAVLAVLCLRVSLVFAAPGVQTTLVSNRFGSSGNGASSWPTVEGYGRMGVFQSEADDLVGDDTNGVMDIFAGSRCNEPFVDGQLGRVSVNADGEEANGASRHPAMDQNSWFLVYESDASNLVAGDENDCTDVFATELTGCGEWSPGAELVSLGASGEQGNGPSTYPSVGGEGWIVAFQSVATNLVDDDGNDFSDIFVRDRDAGTTLRVSVGDEAEEANGPSYFPVVSGDGRYVAFLSEASNLVPDDTNGVADVFVCDLEGGTTVRVSVSSDGEQADGAGLGRPAISQDGRFVAFASEADNLVESDTNESCDVFVYDQEEETTTRASIGLNGEPANGDSYGPGFGSDGRFVTFASMATNLVSDDTNDAADVFLYDRLANAVLRVSVPGEEVLYWESDAASGEAAPVMAGDNPDTWFVAFSSEATNLVEDDLNGFSDVFVRDLSSQYGYLRSPEVENATVTVNGNPVQLPTSCGEDDVCFLSGVSYSVGIQPDPGYRFVNWDCCWRGVQANPVQIVVSECIGLGAYVEPIEHALSLAGSHGQVSVDGDEWDLPWVGGPYEHESTVVLEAIPDPDYLFVEWSGSYEGTDNPAEVTIDEDEEITAVFAPINPTVAISAIGAGTGTVKVNGDTKELPWSASYPFGTSLTLEATPDATFSFDGWSHDLAATDNPITFELRDDMDINAAFDLQQIPLRLAAVGSGSIEVNGTPVELPWTGALPYGSEVSLEAIPAEGRFFAGWSGDVDGEENPLDLVLNEEIGITAAFSVAEVTLNVTGIGDGTVKINGVNHPLPWSGGFSWGTSIELEAVAASGWEFVDWSGDLASTDNPVEFDLTSNVAAQVTFDRAPVTLALTGSGYGDVTVNGIAHTLPWTGSFSYGDEVSLGAVAGDCYRFDGWSGDAGGSANPATITMTGNLEVSAAFTPISRFEDVGCTHWAAEEIAACYDAGIVGGYPDGTYDPDGAVDRAAMAVYMARALAGGDAGIPEGPDTPTFSDVSTDHWAYAYIEYAVERHVVRGYPEGDYRPAAEVTRDQMAAYVARAIVDPTGDDGLAAYTAPSTPSFPDVASTFWAYVYIEYCVEQGVVRGYDDGSYHPEATVTRDQMAVYIAHAFGLL